MNIHDLNSELRGNADAKESYLVPIENRKDLHQTAGWLLSILMMGKIECVQSQKYLERFIITSTLESPTILLGKRKTMLVIYNNRFIN